MSSNDRACARHSSKSGNDTPRALDGKISWTITSRALSFTNGKPRTSIASTMVKTIPFRPIARASMTTAAIVDVRSRRSSTRHA